MSFQAYLDKIEEKTGLTPRQLIDPAHAQGFDEGTKAGEIAAWLKTEHGLGHGHAMALVHVIKNGPQISSKHVGSTGSHRDPSNTLWLDGSQQALTVAAEGRFAALQHAARRRFCDDFA